MPNENFDDINQNDTDNERTEDSNVSNDKSNARRIDEQTNTSGAGSTQRNRADNVGPLDSDFGQLPSQKRRERNSGASGITE